MLSTKQTTNNTKIVEHDDKTAVHNAHPLAVTGCHMARDVRQKNLTNT